MSSTRQRKKLSPTSTVPEIQGAPPASEWRFLINAFIVFHVVAILSWTSPYENQAVYFVNDIVRNYMRFTGVWQSWDMFSPDPVKALRRMDAKITLADGSTRDWLIFDDHSGNVLKHLRNERFRKWSHDNVRLDSNWTLWEPAALYAAHRFNDRTNPPVKVELNRNWADLLPPEKATPENTTTPWSHFTFYTRPILPKDLR